MTRSTDTEDVHRSASFSVNKRHRLWLRREWSAGPQFAFVGLNPSIADHERDDPTIRRLVAFAKREGCGSLVVVNLFSVIATLPAALKHITGEERGGGDENDGVIHAITHDTITRIVVVGWGTHGATYPSRVERVLAILPRELQCFGITAATRQPQHPLYLAKATPLIPFPRTSSPPPE